jgi:hypothetical protein
MEHRVLVHLIGMVLIHSAPVPDLRQVSRDRTPYYPVDCSLTSMLHSVSRNDKAGGENLHLPVPAREYGYGRYARYFPG